MEEDIDHKEDNMNKVDKMDKEYSDYSDKEDKVDFVLEEDMNKEVEEQNLEYKMDFEYKLVEFVEFVDLIQLVNSIIFISCCNLICSN